jgi:hypothetical protein
MKNEKLNYDDVAEKLDSDDGIMQDPDMNWILEYITSEYGSNLDNTSSWAQGKERLLIYTETTADSYDVYACTHEHNGTKDFGSDIYYYVDGAEFAERAIDTLCQGGDVWIADHVWDEMEDDFECALQEWWSDLYDDLHQDKVDELVDEGYEYEE